MTTEKLVLEPHQYTLWGADQVVTNDSSLRSGGPAHDCSTTACTMRGHTKHLRVCEVFHVADQKFWATAHGALQVFRRGLKSKAKCSDFDLGGLLRAVSYSPDILQEQICRTSGSPAWAEPRCCVEGLLISPCFLKSQSQSGRWSLVSLVWLWNLVARKDQAGELVGSCPSQWERRTSSALSHSGQGLSLKCQPWKHHFKTNSPESIQQPGNLWARLVGLDGWASRSHRSTWQLPGRPPPWPFLSQSGKVACDSSA